MTLRDACFANYHCNDLPNTHCSFDRAVPMYNSSCQCIPGNKPFEPDPRTGLIEGCAPLTEADKASVLGCSDKVEVDDDFQWRPDELHATQRDSTTESDYRLVLGLLQGD